MKREDKWTLGVNNLPTHSPSHHRVHFLAAQDKCLIIISYSAEPVKSGEPLLGRGVYQNEFENIVTCTITMTSVGSIIPIDQVLIIHVSLLAVAFSNVLRIDTNKNFKYMLLLDFVSFLSFFFQILPTTSY